MQLWFRCSTDQACHSYAGQYRVDASQNAVSLLSQGNLLCERQNLNEKQIFSILSAVLLLSQLSSGFLMDRYGRKRVIIWKAVGLAISLACLVPLGFVKNAPMDAVLFFLFTALFSTTFSFDLMIFGIEQLPKNSRDNYIVSLTATRVVGIAIVSVCFYLMSNWVYFEIL